MGNPADNGFDPKAFLAKVGSLAFLSPRKVSERVMYPWPIGEFDNAMDKVRTEATK